jgi:hypothetical protein
LTAPVYTMIAWFIIELVLRRNSGLALYVLYNTQILMMCVSACLKFILHQRYRNKVRNMLWWAYTMQIRSRYGLWLWYIIVAITILDFIHHPVLYLEHSVLKWKTGWLIMSRIVIIILCSVFIKKQIAAILIFHCRCIISHTILCNQMIWLITSHSTSETLHTILHILHNDSLQLQCNCHVTFI